MTPPRRTGIGATSGGDARIIIRAGFSDLYKEPVNVPKYAHIVGRASAKVGKAIWKAESGTRGMLLAPKKRVGSAW